MADIARANVVANRYSHAFCVLVLMPTAVTQTVSEPSKFHVTALAATTAWTAWVGALRRWSIAHWMDKDDE